MQRLESLKFTIDIENLNSSSFVHWKLFSKELKFI